jgi:hypothetical protein
MSGTQSVTPSFRQSLKGIEAVNRLVNLSSNMVNGAAGKDAKFQVKTLLVVYLANAQGKDLQRQIHGINLHQVLLDKIGGIHQGPALQLAFDIAHIKILPPLKFKSNSPTKWRQSLCDQFF